MPPNWKPTTWGELATLEYGKGLNGYENANGNYPVYGTNGMIGWNTEPLFDKAGVIIGRKGAYRGVHYSKTPFYVIDTAFYLKPKTDIDLRWAYYQLLTLDINSMDSGSAIPSTSRPDFYALPVLLPSLSEQRAIAGVLGALDDKIELNRRMNRTLESMARAVFRQWFVENEDVGDWEIKSIGEITERVGMGPFGSSIKVDTFVDEGIPVINGQQLREFMLEDTGFHFISLEHAEKLKNANVYPGDIVITHRGTLGQVSLIPYDAKYKRYIVSQSQFFVRCNPEMITPNFLIYYLSSPEGQYKLLANRSAVGVPAIAQPVTYLRSIEIAVPPKEILDAFEQIVAPLHSKYSANRRESRTLASLRDSLLPKLMRGEVRVKDAEGES